MAHITIDGDHIWRGGEKIGYLDDERVFAHDGNKLGYYDNKYVYNVEGHRLAYVEGDKLYSESGDEIGHLETISEAVQGAVRSPMERAAVYVLLGN